VGRDFSVPREPITLTVSPGLSFTSRSIVLNVVTIHVSAAIFDTELSASVRAVRLGLTNPGGLNQLLGFNPQLRTLEFLHAKVFIFDSAHHLQLLQLPPYTLAPTPSPQDIEIVDIS
jgi:hypothetical protein